MLRPSAIPPLTLPDGTRYAPGMAGTQFINDDGTSVQPATRPLQSQYSQKVPGGKSTYTPAPITSYAPAAAAPALTAPVSDTNSAINPGLADLLSKAKTALAPVAADLDKNGLSYLNGALGVAGAIQYATAKAPKMIAAPDLYAPVIRPAQGLNASSLEAGRRAIDGAQAQAGRATGSDTGTTAAMRLIAQQQAGDQQAGLSLKDNEAFQQDQRRVDDQTNQAYDANYKTQRSFVEKRFDLQQRGFEARRQQGAAMSQAALTYFVQDRAAKREDVNRADESAEAARLGISLAEYRYGRNRRSRTGSNSSGSSSSNSQTANDDDDRPSYRAQGGKLPAPDLFARGGSLSASVQRLRGREAFSERLLRLTLQAVKEFSRSQSDATKSRSRSFGSK